MRQIANRFPSLLASVFAAGLLTALPAAGQEKQAGPAAKPTCVDLGWSIAEEFEISLHCDEAREYAMPVGAIRICELEGYQGFADALGKLKAECDSHFRPRSTPDSLWKD